MKPATRKKLAVATLCSTQMNPSLKLSDALMKISSGVGMIVVIWLQLVITPTVSQLWMTPFPSPTYVHRLGMLFSL